MTVRMTHPLLPGRVIEVPDDAVPGHARSGWERAPDPEPEPEPEPTPTEPGPDTPGGQPTPTEPTEPGPDLPEPPEPTTPAVPASRRARPTEEQ